MKGKFSNLIAFDLGSSKIAALAANINKNGQAKINAQILQYSEGIKSGVITNMRLAESSIIAAIYALEQETDKSIKEISLSLSGARVKSYYINHKMKIGSQAISKQDLRKIITKALAEFKVKDQEIIHYFPLEFVIDGKQTVEDPIGLYAHELSCQLHIISADSLMLMNLTKCLGKCHVTINDVFLSIYASAMACLTNDEKELGSIIIDIGSNTSSFAVFLHNKMIYTGYIPIGGMDITHDIAKQFSISIKSADKIKILYGNASHKLIKNSTIRIDEFDPDNNYNSELSISAIDLARVIEKRIDSIFTKIKTECDRISMNHLLAKRVIVTGGGASLPGILNRASEILEKQVRTAKPEVIAGLMENYNPYIYSAVIGIIKAKSLQYQKKSFRHDIEENSGLIRRTFLWLKENI